MRILALGSELPFPPVSGGKARTYHLLQALSGEHEITLVTFTDSYRQQSDGPHPPFPIEVVTVPYHNPPLYAQMYGSDREQSEAAYRILMREAGEPWFVSCYACPMMERTLECILRRGFDLILIEHTFMGRFLPALPRDLPKVLDLHNVHSLMSLREAESKTGEEKQRLIWEARRTRRFEQKACAACQACWVCSDAEVYAARDLLGVRHLFVIPNGVDTSAWVTAEGPTVPGSVLFTGTMNYEPNVEAASFFTAEILPRIRAVIPAAKFHIVGTKPTQQVSAMASEDVVVHGEVPDMRPYFYQAEVVVVPLLHGGGTRVKILEAAACGKAIVTTTLGAEGLSLRPGDDALFAESPEAFADAVIQLLSDASGRMWIGRNARHVAEQYDWSSIGARALHLVGEALRRGRGHAVAN
jgi:polysaccharide biosynthesis protein PslH